MKISKGIHVHCKIFTYQTQFSNILNIPHDEGQIAGLMGASRINEESGRGTLVATVHKDQTAVNQEGDVLVKFEYLFRPKSNPHSIHQEKHRSPNTSPHANIDRLFAVSSLSPCVFGLPLRLRLQIKGVLNKKDFQGKICPGLDYSSKAPG
ncbi:MAG: hypothetical protein KC587_07600, partial [Nitrospira sp.]|nr:hypothetical protein [Nitrospira sp.]